MDITLKYTRFLEIGNVALYHEMAIFIVSMFQYTQSIGSRSVKLKQISSLGISHLCGKPFSFPMILLSEISRPNCAHVNTCRNVQILHLNASIDETLYLSDPFQC